MKICFLFLALLLLTSPAYAKRADFPFRKGDKFCEKGKCYHSDDLGSWGLEPKRTYTLLYDGDPACSVIRDALNNAIKKGPQARRDITFPVPRYPEYESKDPVTIERRSHIKEFTYVAQTPLFSDPIFLRWNYLGGYPAVDFPEMHDSKDYETDPNLAYQHDIEDTFPKRWLIVPFKNDGHPYLVTGWYWGSSNSTRSGAPDEFKVWNVPATELDGKDWNLSQTYAPYQPMGEVWPNADSAFPNQTFDPLSRYVELYPYSVNRDSSEAGFYTYPNIAQTKDNKQKLKLWTSTGRRTAAALAFAYVNGRYYVVFQEMADQITVLDASKKPGDDACYLQSKITERYQR